MHTPKTIEELKQWMLDNNRFNELLFDGSIANEGYGIEKWGELYVWYYAERGNSENLTYFQTEMEIVEYAYNYLCNNK